MEGGVKRIAAAPTVDAVESPEKMMESVIAENPVVILSRRSCCMCHVMKTLLSLVGVRAKVVELEETEVAAGGGAMLPEMSPEMAPEVARPVLFIGGELVGRLERLMAMHLSGRLVPRLREAGASFE